MADSFGNFDLIKRKDLGFSNIQVTKWRSRKTGLSIVHLDYEAPIVKGYLTVCTEIFDDSGCPHTLEHLVFMGSKKYPYKGIIDHLANRGFSNGTNAWTADDHTCYTLSTAGGQGFLQMLPVYVDHILFPTITDAAFTTEVHHIDPEGNDSGVVYSEMQGRENTSGDLMDLSMKRLIYPDGSAFRSETGGLMEALRKLDVQQIRDYHSKYYVPHNLTLIVGGKFAGGTNSLLNVVQNEIEPSLISSGFNKGPRPAGWIRPFLESPSARREPLKNLSNTVEFPEKDESMGELLLVFQGPGPQDLLSRRALDIMSTYLTSSSVAPLNKEYIETDNPLCTYIYFDEEPRPQFIDLPVYIGSVPTEHLDTLDQKLKSSLERIVSEGIDMTRMAMVINRDQRQLRNRIDASKGSVFSDTVIEDTILGAEDGSDLIPAMDKMAHYETLRNWTNGQWTGLLKKYYIDSPCVVVRGKPSGALADKLENDEKERIDAQVKALGPEGLERAKVLLEKSKKENDKPIPEEVLTSFPVPDVSSISWINVQSVQEGNKIKPIPEGKSDNATLVKHIETDGNPLPFFVQFDHVQSDFITVDAQLSLSTLPDRLRPFMTTYLSAFFSLPVKTSSGQYLSHEEVVAKLDDETVSYENGLGLRGYFGETMHVSISVEKEKYEAAVRWMRDLLYGIDFDVPRLQVTCAKILQGIPELKRDGSTVLSSYNLELLYGETSTQRSNAILGQMKAIPELMTMLRENPDQARKDFEEIRKYLTDPSGIRFSVTGNVLDAQNPRSVWTKYFSQLIPDVPLRPILLSVETLNELGRNPQKKTQVISLPTIESTFSTHTSKTIQGFKHPEYPALIVALEVMNATESYLWRYIRGSGLAYGASIACDIESGLLSFSLYRSSNSLEAFRQAAMVVEDLVKGKIPLEDTTIDAAKSTIVYEIASSVSKPRAAALSSYVNQALKGVSQNNHRILLEKYQAVTKDEILKALEKYVVPLFKPETSVAVIVTAPGKVKSTADGMVELGFDVETREIEASPEGSIADGSEHNSENDSDSGTDSSSR